MKKIFNLLIVVFAFALIASSVSALSLTAKFESTDTTYSSFDFGESDNYLVAAIISHHSPLLEVEAKLFKLTSGKPVYVKTLFQDTHSGSIIYAPSAFPLTQAEYEQAGSYFIDIKATETTMHGNQIINSVMIYFDVNEIEVDLLPPVADFIFSPSVMYANDPVTFTSTSFDSDGVVVLEEWFVDGVLVESFNEENSNFVFAFPSSGIFSVTLKVTDNDGLTDEITKNFYVRPEIVVPNEPPVAQFNHIPQEPFVGDVVSFTSTSFDNDGSVVLEQWFFDGVLIHQFAEEGSSFTRTFSLPGSYEVKLKVTDNQGATDETTKIVVVKEAIPENVPPVARFDYDPINPFVGDVVTFKSQSFDSDGVVVLEQWFINNQLVASFNEQNSVFEREFKVPGSYNVKLKVVDDDGATDEITKVVVVQESVPENIPPISKFIFNPSSPFVGDVVTFISESYDPDGVVVLEQWFINNKLVASFNEEGSSFDRTFTAPGSYTVRLRVTDNDGATRDSIKFVSVSEFIPENILPVANFIYSPQNPTACDVVSFTSTSFDSDGFIVNERWFIGNTLVHEGVNETSFEHTFTSPGTFRVSIIVTDNDGATSEKTRNVQVSGCVIPIPPKAQFIYEPDELFVGDLVTFTSTSFDSDGFIVSERWFIGNTLVHEGVNETSFVHELTHEGPLRVRLVVTDNDGLTDEVVKTLTVLPPIPENVPPVAKFVYAPQNPTTCDVVTLTSKSFDSDGVIVNERWFINDNLVFEGVNETSFDYTFPYFGSYVVKLVVEDDDGATASMGRSIFVSGCPNLIPPTAQFEYVPDEIFVGDLVNFTSQSFDPDGYIVNEKWFINNDLFNEGVNETSFNHVFNNEGYYKVTLVVIDNNGLSDEITKKIKVKNVIPENIPPVANFIYSPTAPYTNQEIVFTSTSFDPDGVIVKEEWDFNNDGTFDMEGSVVIWGYTAPGTYYVRLKVTDNDGASAEKIRKIIVVEKPNLTPVARFDYSPKNPFTGDVVTFTSESFDLDGFITDERWFIDNELVYEGVNETSFNHIFTKEGSYTVKLIVTDNRGATAEASKVVVVQKLVTPNKPPVARFTHLPQSPIQGESVTFTSKSFDPDGYIVNERWFINNELVHEGVNETSFNHVFNNEGTYSVRLRVTDNNGASSEVTKNIVVSVPEGDLVAIIAGPQSPFVGREVTYDGSNSYDTSGAEIVLYNWVLTKEGVEVASQSSTSPIFNHTFTSTGRHTLTLVVVNEFGKQAQATLSIYASRDYEREEDAVFGQVLSVDYHYVYGSDFGVVESDEYFTVYITVTNRGDETLRNLKTTFALPEFGISEKSSSFNLRAGETRTVEFHTLIDSFDFIPLGYHDALLGVSGEGIIRNNYFPMTLV
jgi:PKD repeat protein